MRNDISNVELKARLQAARAEVVRLESLLAQAGAATGATDPLPGYGDAVVYCDVTERQAKTRQAETRQAETRLRESEELNQLLFEEAKDAITLRDAAGRLVKTNRAYETLTGRPRAELIGRTAVEAGIVTEVEDQRLRATSRQILDGARDACAEFIVRRPDGEQRRVEAHGFAAQVNGELHGLAILLDITEQVRADQELRESEEAARRANLELEQALRFKGDFLATMSHELRTPLHTILSYTELLQSEAVGALNDKQLRGVSAIEESGRHLLALINDILDLSKINADKLELACEATDVDAVCQSSLYFLKEPAFKQGITLRYAAEQSGVSIIADGRRLKQILVNLLSNAVKFTPAGGSVSLEVSCDPAHAALLFTVADTGIGIAQEDLDRIFAPFEQVNSTGNWGQEGTGLGLALVRRLAELHDGSVSVASERGQGSRFTVRLPWQPRSTCPPPALMESCPVNAVAAPTGESLGGTGVVLIVDDNEASRIAVGDYLHQLGYSVVLASDGVEALAQAAVAHPGLILMDIQMPNMDGLETTRQLRANPQTAALPIVGLTALAMAGDRERSLAAGMDEYVTKPFGLKELAQTVKRLLA